MSPFEVLALALALSFCVGIRCEQNQTHAQSECKPKACLRNADSEKAVCGSDGLSYPNKCHLERARCQNGNVTLVKRGACKTHKSCAEWQKSGNAHASNGFRPQCRRDGSYEQIQCHSETGYCWCVTVEGVPIPNTAVKVGRKVRCGRRNKNRRRAPSRKNKHKICKRNEKALLNANLINSFHSEFFRENGRNESDALVVAWKFRSLDTDGDFYLDKTEYKDIRRLVKKVMKPKKCAKLFPKSCDVDIDHAISLQEWTDCLPRDGIDDGRIDAALDGGEDEEEDYVDSYSSNLGPPHTFNGVTSMDDSQSYPDSDSFVVEDDPSNCHTDKKAALAEGDSSNYIPECTADGRYQKVQCYKSAGYCWCVDEDTGKNIPGTSVKNGTPNCDLHKVTNRAMKGCPDEKKLVFLRELIHFLHTKMSEMVSANSTFTSLAWIQTKEEQAATWSFVVFDKNKNKMLEKSEWKAFKDMVGGVKGLKKCGKKLPRYCDSNKDRLISMTEWLDCLNIQQGAASGSSSANMSVRTGKKNPLSMLKDD
ncbi:SPARC-related modular calcium-binding protein 2 isoform X2 [Cylas formicarius]|uniref:SPARC-related modular calcium-binding protein 2 isoform X2 n=1 Tax=Cylas formicarius TaxID=197179 RepID=UPI0029588A0C|nr:SPARC-related modular calcium-binding protein 2 isoform X2 [Cylas formicarius]